MPTWEITAPDGSTYEIEGDSEPTQEELDQMFPAPPIQSVGEVRLPESATLRDVLRQPMPAVSMESEVMRSAFPGVFKPEDLVPAVRKIGGEVVLGEPWDTHPDIIDREGIGAKEIDQRGFAGPWGQFMDREAAAKGTLIPTKFEEGRLHSTDLMEAQEAPPELPTFEPPTKITTEGPVYAPTVKPPELSLYEEPTWADQPLAPVGTWIYGKGKLIDQLPPEMREKEYAKFTMGLSEEIRDNLDALTTPKNLALMGMAKGISLLGTVGKRAVAAVFAYLMGEHAPETLTALKEELSKPKEERDSGKIGTLIGRATIEIGGATAGGIAALRPGRVPAARPAEKIVAREIKAEVPKAEVPPAEPAPTVVPEVPKPIEPKHPVDAFLASMDKDLTTGPQQKQLATDAGLKARSVDDLNRFVEARERFIAENKKFIASKELDKGMQSAAKGQLAREALEVATDSGSQMEAERKSYEQPLGVRPLDYKTQPEVAQWFRDNAERLKKAGFHVPEDIPVKPEATKPPEALVTPAAAGPSKLIREYSDNEWSILDETLIEASDAFAAKGSAREGGRLAYELEDALTAFMDYARQQHGDKTLWDAFRSYRESADETKTNLRKIHSILSQEGFGPKSKTKPAAAPAAVPAPQPEIPPTAAVPVIRTAPMEGKATPQKIKKALVSEAAAAAKEAPALADIPEGTTPPKITIAVPDDGSFTVDNTKEALTSLSERAKGIETKPPKPYKESRAAAGIPPDVWIESSEPTHILRVPIAKNRFSLLKGKPISISGRELFLTSDGESFTVTEPTTGMYVGSFEKTSKKAIQSATEALKSSTDYDKRVADAIAKHGRAPAPEPISKEPSPAMAGPGTPSSAQPMDPTGTHLAQLTQAIRQQGTSPGESVSARIKKAVDLAGRLSRGKDAITRTLSSAKAASSALLDKYLNLPAWRDFETSVGRWTGADQQTSHEVRQFQKVLNSKVPSRLKQEAMTNWIQADGDEALLRQRADASSPAVRAGYEEALRLTPDEKTTARQISSFLDSRLQEGIDAGLLQQGVDNYVTQVWRKPTTTTQRLWTELFGNDRLNPNFRFARKRIFDSYFEGEQAGFRPRDKRISTLISAYDLAFNKALSARALIRELHEGKAADGQPIVMTSGSGVPVPKGQEPPEAFLIKPHTRPEGAVSADGRPYRVVDHWALRGWKWATKAPTGEPIFVQGDMLVHPDYVRKLSRMLKTSALRQIPATRFLLQAGALAKQTKLSLSPFHTVQEGIHAMAHRVDPTGVVKSLVDIDFSHPEQKALVDHGLMVSDTNAAELFAEGLSGGGVVGKIPGLGRLQQWYTDMTFKDYIPRLKMTMALDALKRNREAYAKKISKGKITDDQVLAMTARQSNAAFGEQNYRMMGRSATLQDFLRLSLLAPDFLEARARFVGQALKPYNREQRIALGIMAASLYTTSRVMNKALDDDYHWDKPFSVFYKGREYHLRTILGDVQHMITDPRGFWYNRLAPITRTVSEYITGRDDRGIKRSSMEQFGDFLQWFKPIPLQVRPGEGVPQAVLGASGVPSRMATAQQQLYQLLDTWRVKQTDPKIKEAYERQRQETHIQSPYAPLRVALLANDIPSARKAYQDLLKGRTPEQIAMAIRPFSGGYSMKTGQYTPTRTKPMTGSRKTEQEFLSSLTPEQRRLYDNALLERTRVWENFLKMRKQP